MNKVDYSKYFSIPYEMELIKAVMKGDSSAVKRLAVSGVNINAVGKHEVTPHRTAIKCQQKEIVLLLLKLGVDPNFTTPGKAVPAFAATTLDDPMYLNILWDHGLNPNIKQDGEPIIFAAISRGNEWLNFKTLINRGADINSITSNHSSLVLELVGVSQYDYAKALILDGANFTTPNDTGLTVVEVLVNDQTTLGENKKDPNYIKRAELLEMLRERGVKIPQGF